MKAVEVNFTAYSDAQWWKIKRQLARSGVDADTVLVGRSRRPLRIELERLAARYVEHSRMKFLSLRQIKRLIADTRAKVSAARCVVAPKRLERLFMGDKGDELANEAHRVLTAIESELQGPSPLLYDIETYEATNAEQEARNGYFYELLKVWRQLVGTGHDRKRAGFLLACTASFKFNAKQIDYLLHRGLADLLKRKSKARAF